MNYFATWRLIALLTCVLVENDGFITVEQDAIFDVPADRPGEHNFLQVSTFLKQIIDGISMGDANHVLLDNRAVVKHLGDVVAGRTNQFHAAFERLVIRSGADKGGQKGMMDVDNEIGRAHV